MNRFGNRTNFDRRFNLMWKLFSVFFIFVAFVVFSIWFAVGYIVYSTFNDPTGTANAVGSFAAEVIKPVNEVLK